MADDWLNIRMPITEMATDYIRGRSPKVKIDSYSASVLASYYGVGTGFIEQGKDPKTGGPAYYIVDPLLVLMWSTSGLQPLSTKAGQVERRDGMTKEDFGRAMGFKLYDIDPESNPWDVRDVETAMKRMKAERYMSASPETQTPEEENTPSE
jgi:hypothetical protein